MRVIIADDHRIVRDGLRMILSHDPEIEIVEEVEDGEHLLAVLEDAVVGVAAPGGRLKAVGPTIL